MQHTKAGKRALATLVPCALALATWSCLAAKAQAATVADDPALTSDAAVASVAAPHAAAAEPKTQSSAPPTTANKAKATADKDKAVQLGSVMVTAQKVEQNAQSVPIALSVFDAKSLDDHKIEGGAELLRAVPNVSFSKSNFASYNFSIRGVGTKALSVTTDPGVAISFNGMPLIRNRLFEQEYFDVDRVEVLRGPQGTLYGRNAIGGVVNMIPALPDPGAFGANLKLEGGNFDSRRVSGMVNIPLSDTFAIRAAGALTKRGGFDYNSVTNQHVNGRNQWGGRLGALWQPNDKFSANLLWEHYSENDDRSRTGKVLCNADPGPSALGGRDLSGPDFTAVRNELNQGCLPGSLYGRSAFGVPNGASLPQIQALGGNSYIGVDPNTSGYVQSLIGNGLLDPFAGVTQSTNLRNIATTFDPKFKAKNDVAQLNLKFNVTDDLTLVSQTGYSRDSYWSTQDYNRFPSNPVWNNSNGLVDVSYPPPDYQPVVAPAYPILPGGVFTDPQLGPSTGFLEADLVRSKSHQWTQELRLQSSFDGPFNFSLGANALDFKIDEDYFVFSNAFTMLAKSFFNGQGAGANPLDCTQGYAKILYPGTSYQFNLSCVYIDPNRIGSLDGQGHNYFRSRNVAETRSYAAFGEAYWQMTDSLKLTAGLRFTRDEKTTTPYPTQLLLYPSSFLGGGFVNSGYPENQDIRQVWTKPTGRLVLDWAPQLPFTDSTLVYTSYSRGYNAGGTNSPPIGANPAQLSFTTHPQTFKPEYVNAWELGTKNMMAGGKVMLNASAFYYDFTDYQVSQIVDRATLNENFNAKMFGVELQAAWEPTRALHFDGNVGYLHTRIADGAKSIDVMNRTQGNPDWMVLRPWVQNASNCVAPTAVVEKVVQWIAEQQQANPSLTNSNIQALSALCTPLNPIGNFGYTPGGLGYIQGILGPGVTYDPVTDAPNGGQGFNADLGGKQLPNSPHWTGNFGAQYTFFLPNNASLAMRGDYYRQSSSYARVYNTSIDRLKAWDNVNLSVTLDLPSSGWTWQLYVKNLMNKTPLTDAFVNSDDSNLTTNVFTLDPRIIGLSVRKEFF